MSRKLATIQKIRNIEAIPNADKIVVASVLGWKTVILKDQYKVGDYVIYCEIDSLLPLKPQFEFLRKNCYKKLSNGLEGFRIKTIRLKGQISQGICFPMSMIFSLKDRKEGDDVTEEMGVQLYQPPIPACLQGKIKGAFPSFLPKTDETRVQVLQDVLSRHKGIQCYVTEKLDGTSATFYIKDGVFGVCSRNLELLETEGNAYWDVARRDMIEEKLCAFGGNIAIQGELIGHGINSNSLNVEGKKVLFFNAFDIDSFKYVSFKRFKEIFKELGLETVPILSEKYYLIDDVAALIKEAEGKSVLNAKQQREGIVIRPIEEKMDLQMASGFGNGRVSFKAINPEYLLEEE